MRYVVRRGLLLSLSVFLALPAAHALSAAELAQNLAHIRLPEGFQISVYASGVENARQMAVGDQGTVFVGSRQAGLVHALKDTNGDNVADKMYPILEPERMLPDGTTVVMPSGIAYRDGSLYVAAVSHILRYDDIENRLDNPGVPAIVTSELPDHKHHGWKFIAFGPDDKLYFSVGAWCNICENDDPMFATIARMNPDGSGIEVIARGVRNTVGFDFHPETGELWFTENGGDNLGNDMPADELNRLVRPGQHFGYPYVHQGDFPDPRYGEGLTASDYTDYSAPAMKLGPHVAAIGARFYTGAMFPQSVRNHLFIAEHGSWNRPIGKTGYRITFVRIENNEAVSYDNFATGWLRGDGSVWGRPADVLVMPDGALLISDDQANAIYRVTYTAP